MRSILAGLNSYAVLRSSYSQFRFPSMTVKKLAVTVVCKYFFKSVKK